jgi:hypothetical protein
MNDAEHKALIERLEGVVERNTLAMEAVVGAMTQIDGSMARIDRSMARMRRAMDDMGDQIRANTQAVLKALDRFDAAGGTA